MAERTAGASPSYSPGWWRVASHRGGGSEASLTVAFVSLLDLIDWSALEVGGRGVGRGDNGPAVYGPVGIRAAAMWRKSAASGQAAAKARRTRAAVSMTRAPSLRRRKRMVVNSAVASACVAGVASRTVKIRQSAAVCRIR